MIRENFSIWKNLQYDLPAAVVVLLVALPLCLGIALASGAPLLSGIIAGIVGGVVVGAISKSSLSVSGPAAGLTIIVLGTIQELPSFNAFLLAVCLAGVFQILFSFLRAGIIGDFIPSTVIKGMLASIGIILILKQLPHAVGYDVDHEGDTAFWQRNGENTFSDLWNMLSAHVSFGAIIISVTSLAFLFWWDKKQPIFKSFLRYVPGSLLVVAFGIAANEFFKNYVPDLAISVEHLVSVPVYTSIESFVAQFTFPDTHFIHDQKVWLAGATLAVVASLETLLSIEAVDKIDPYKRVTPTNRELFAQGIGNICSGLIGGLPITSVIVRSSANTTAGAKTKLATIIHGILLFVCVVSVPRYLNFVPLAALAAILIAVGYKLTKPAIFLQKYQKGLTYFVPFLVTIMAILLTDLLIGIGVGVITALIFLVRENFRAAILNIVDGNNYLVRIKKDLFFMHKYELKHVLNKVPAGANLLLDLSRAHFVDLDNIEIINDFIASAQFKAITITIKNSQDSNLPINGVMHATL